MPEQALPDSLAARLAELERRLLALETAPQSNRINLLDGNLRFRLSTDENVSALMGTDGEGNDIGFWTVDSEGQVRAYVGTGTDGADGLISLRNNDGRSILYALSSTGLVRPRVPVPWTKNPGVPVDANGRATTTSGTYDTLYRSYLNCAPKIYHRWSVTVGGGVTSCAFKLTGQDLFNGGTETTIYEETGITASKNIDRSDSIPALAANGLDIIGELIVVTAYLRVTGGAGTIALAPIAPAIPTS